MIALTEKTIYDLKLILLDHVQGTAIDVTKVRLAIICAELNVSCTTLYKSIPIECTPQEPQDHGDSSSDEDSPSPESPTDSSRSRQTKDLVPFILHSLHLKESNNANPGSYERILAKSKTLYDLLKTLTDDEHPQINYFFEELVKTIKPRSNWTPIFLLSAMISAAVGGTVYFNRQYLAAIGKWFAHSFPLAINWLAKTFSVLRNIPLLGIIVNSLLLTWNWYNTFFNGSNLTSKRLLHLFFKTLSISLTISAYTLAFFSAGIITGPSAILFILASATKVVQGSYEWWKNAKPETLPGRNSSWLDWAKYIREENLHQRAKRATLVKIGAALFTTIAVGVWDFFPPSLVFTAVCVAFISFTALTEWSLLHSIKETAADNLQTAISKITTHRSSDLRPADQSDFARLDTQALQVATALSQVEARELVLQTAQNLVRQEQDQLKRLRNEIQVEQTALEKSRADARALRNEVEGVIRAIPDTVTGSCNKILQLLGTIGASATPTPQRLAANDAEAPPVHQPGLFSQSLGPAGESDEQPIEVQNPAT